MQCSTITKSSFKKVIHFLIVSVVFSVVTLIVDMPKAIPAIGNALFSLFVTWFFIKAIFFAGRDGMDTLFKPKLKTESKLEVNNHDDVHALDSEDHYYFDDDENAGVKVAGSIPQSSRFVYDCD